MASSSSRVHVQNRIALQAARDGDLRTLKEMAERADLRGAKDVEGANALHLAADKGSLECCEFLIEEVGLGVNTATTTGKTPLSCALYAGNAQVMKYFIDHGANPKKATAQGLTMLHIAAGRGLCEPLELLLSQGMIPVDIMLVDYVGTPLHAAASRGQHQAMKILLEHGADPNILMDENVSPLMLACCEKSLKCMRLLIEAGADVNCNSYRGPTPLAHALKAGWTDIVKFLLEAGADPNIPDMNRFALQAAYNGDLRTLKEMAKWTDLRGAKDVEGANALHLAADKGSLECCKFLIEEVGLGVNSVTTTGKTPLSCAVYVGHVEVMKYLLDGGANPRKANAQGVTMLHLAAGRGLCEPLELLLSQGMIPVDIMLGAYVGAPLHAAATMGQHQAMKILLEHGADPNIHMDDNVSPLMLACWEKSLKCMRLLIEAGADANGSSYHGPTPLTHAVEAGWTDIVKFLLEAGADPNIPAEGGDIPIKLAAKCGRRDLVKILFSKTIQVPSLPYWTVDGIIRTMESPLIRHQDPVPGDGTITALKSRGRDAFAKEDYHAALYFFGRVIEIDPSDATMFSNRSACWLRMREWERALSDAQHCRKLQPDWCKGWFRQGTALTFMENFQGAADAFREALKREPENDEIKSALGEAMESAARSGDKKH